MGTVGNSERLGRRVFQELWEPGENRVLIFPRFPQLGSFHSFIVSSRRPPPRAEVEPLPLLFAFPSLDQASIRTRLNRSVDSVHVRLRISAGAAIYLTAFALIAFRLSAVPSHGSQSPE